MASGFLGLPRNPEQGLEQMAQETPAPAVAPSPAVPASTPAPAAPSGGGGGIGEAFQNLLAGRGLMGAQPGDDKVDPTTGVTQAQMRQASMQNLMGIGMTLIAAGARQSNDSRAAILAGLPKFADTSGQLNQFARMRLEMAQAKLAERKQAAVENREKGFQQLLFGGSGAAAGVGVTPGTIGGTGGVPAAGGDAANMPAPGAAPMQGGAPATAGAAPAAANSLTAGISPGVLRIIGAMGAEDGLKELNKLRQGLDSQEYMGEPEYDNHTGQYIAKKYKPGTNGPVVTGYQSLGEAAKVLGTPVVEKNSGQVVAPIRQGKNVTGLQNIGAAQRPIEYENGEDGKPAFQVTRNADGAVISRTAIPKVEEDPQDVEERKLSAGLRTKRFEALSNRMPEVQTASANYDKVLAAETAVRKNKTLVGFGSDAKTQAMTMLGGLGLLSKEGQDALANTSDVKALFGQAGGEFAKKFYGPQISDADVKNANAAVGGILSGDPAVVANSLSRIRKNYRQQIETYNSDVEGHNSKLAGIRSESLRADITATPLKRDFAEPDLTPTAEEKVAREKPGVRNLPPGMPPPAASGTVTPDMQSAAAAELARRRAQKGK